MKVKVRIPPIRESCPCGFAKHHTWLGYVLCLRGRPSAVERAHPNEAVMPDEAKINDSL